MMYVLCVLFVLCVFFVLFVLLVLLYAHVTSKYDGVLLNSGYTVQELQQPDRALRIT